MDLSKTEYQVAELVTRGYSEKEIACKLFISPKTVHTHTYNIRKKWNARCAVDVARIFILKLDNPEVFHRPVIPDHPVSHYYPMCRHGPEKADQNISKNCQNKKQ